MATPLKVGLLGAGGISNRHITAYLEHTDRVQLTAVCDIDETRAQEFAKKAGYNPNAAVQWGWRMMGYQYQMGLDIFADDSSSIHPSQIKRIRAMNRLLASY